VVIAVQYLIHQRIIIIPEEEFIPAAFVSFIDETEQSITAVEFGKRELNIIITKIPAEIIKLIILIKMLDNSRERIRNT